MAQIVRDSLGAGGVNLFVADGEVAFQDVPHFHVHVIPRYPNDGFGLTFPARLHGDQEPGGAGDHRVGDPQRFRPVDPHAAVTVTSMVSTITYAGHA